MNRSLVVLNVSLKQSRDRRPRLPWAVARWTFRDAQTSSSAQHSGETFIHDALRPVLYGFRSDASTHRGIAPRTARRAWLVNLAVWTVFGLLQAATWILAPIGSRYPSPFPLIAIALFNAYLWALLTPAIFPLAARVSHATERRILWLLAIVVLGLTVAALVALLAANFHGGLPWGAKVASAAQSRFSFWALSRWYFEEVVLFFLVFAAGVASDMFRTFQSREQEGARLKAQAVQLEAERAELKARLADARLAVLRSQLNPHFLFNTLNAVSALVVKDPVGVRDMIALLSELLRSALTDADEEISVAREMTLLRLYLDILEIRYQGQLQTRITVDDDVRDALVPRMILQPLVENAMKHGVAPARGDGHIEIQAQREGSDVVLTVQDSGGADVLPAARDGAGVGLRLTRQRLSELYGDAYRLELFPANGGGMKARIVLPYHTISTPHYVGRLADE
jgi:two-component sensor histidine kinase